MSGNTSPASSVNLADTVFETTVKNTNNVTTKSNNTQVNEDCDSDSFFGLVPPGTTATTPGSQMLAHGQEQLSASWTQQNRVNELMAQIARTEETSALLMQKCQDQMNSLQEMQIQLARTKDENALLTRQRQQLIARLDEVNKCSKDDNAGQKQSSWANLHEQNLTTVTSLDREQLHQTFESLKLEMLDAVHRGMRQQTEVIVERLRSLDLGSGSSQDTPQETIGYGATREVPQRRVTLPSQGAAMRSDGSPRIQDPPGTTTLLGQGSSQDPTLGPSQGQSSSKEPRHYAQASQAYDPLLTGNPSSWMADPAHASWCGAPRLSSQGDQDARCRGSAVGNQQETRRQDLFVDFEEQESPGSAHSSTSAEMQALRLPPLSVYKANQSFESWCQQMAYRLPDCSDQQKITCIIGSLPPDLFQYAQNLRHSDKMSLKRFIEAMTYRKSSPTSRDDLKQKLRDSCQRNDQTLREFVNEIRQQARVIWPDRDMDDLQKSKLNDVVIKGMRDSQARLLLMCEADLDLDKIYSISDVAERNHEYRKRRERLLSHDQETKRAKNGNFQKSTEKSNAVEKGSKDQERQKKPVVCYTCQKQGHYSNNCPQKAEGNNKKEKNETPRHCTISGNAFQKNESPYITAKIGKHKLSALIDTGATHSLISKAAARKVNALYIPLTNKRVMKTAATDKLTMSYCTQLDLSFGKKTISTQFFILDNLGGDDLVLGADFLSHHSEYVSVKNALISIDGLKLPLRRADSSMKVSKLAVCKRCTVQPHQEVLLTLEEQLASKQSGVQQLALIQQSAQRCPEGIVVANAVVLPQANQVLAQVTNTTDKPIVLNRGLKVATLEAIDEVQDIEEIDEVPEDDSRADPYAHESVDLEKALQLDHLNPDQRERLLALLMKYTKVFLQKGEPLGCTTLLQFNIDTGDAKPIKNPHRRVPPFMKPLVDAEIDKMLADDIIQPSASEWSSPLVIVKKRCPPGETPALRICVDLRKLNQVVRDDVYPLPQMNDLLEQVAGHVWFSTLDLKSGYWQVPLNAESREKTAFSTHRGLYEFTRLPFGIKTGPAKFQRLINVILGKMAPEKCLVYLDDTIILGRTFDEHLKHLEDVLIAFELANLKLNPEKCVWAQQEVKFLGHIINSSGIATDPAKTEKIRSWPKPRSVKEVRSFVGLCGYYRRFIKDFAKIASPLHDLTKKDALFVWSEKQENAFQQLKTALCSAPILGYPEFEDPESCFLLETDASDTGIGGVLSQKKASGEVKVIAYGSHTLGKHQKQYCATKKELLAVITFIRDYRPYLWGRQFKVITDCASLKWLREFKDPSGQLARWLSQLEEFDFVVEHRPGRVNQNADALSRRHPGYDTCPSCKTVEIGAVKVVKIAEDLLQEVKDAQKSDPSLAQVIARKNRNEPAPNVKDIEPQLEDLVTYAKWWNSLSIENDLVVLWNDEDDEYKVVLPEDFRKTILQQCHDIPIAGHPGIKKTLARIKSRFVWPKLKRTVTQYVQTCETCQQVKGNTDRAKLQPITSTAFNEMLCCDLVGPLNTSKSGNNYILTMGDHFTKWMEAVPIKDKSAKTVANKVIDTWICRYGAPSTILTDCGTEFEAEFRNVLCKSFKIKKVRTTPYHPMTNGMLERNHRTLKSVLQCLVNSYDNDWDEHLQLAMCAFRSAVHDSTGHEPYQLVFGTRMPLPIERVINPHELELDTEYSDSLKELQDNKLKLISACWQIAQKARDSYRSQYDKKVRKEITFNEGDMVYVHDTMVKPGEVAKFHRKWQGPYKVLQRMSPVTYKVQLEEKTPKVLHVNRLKICDPKTRFKPRRTGVNNRQVKERRGPLRTAAEGFTDVGANVVLADPSSM